MTTALIQAGGKSERMRHSHGPTHKALLPVMGVPILERNLCQLLASGLRSIVVVTSRDEPEIAAYVAGRGRDLANSRQAQLDCLVEPAPLGTIGAAAMLPPDSDPVLVVYSDNLTSLDMRALVEHHQRSNAAMTLATHEEPFQIPFGEVISLEGRVVDYREKSIHPIRVSSGIYVLGRPALACLARGERIDSPQLVHRLLARGARVVDYAHRELWADMNDAARLVEIERLIATHCERLDWLQKIPDREDRLVVTVGPGPGGQPITCQMNIAGGPTLGSTALGSFDEIEPQDGRIVRWHVELAVAQTGTSASGDVADQGDGARRRTIRQRALAYAAQHLANVQPTS